MRFGKRPPTLLRKTVRPTVEMEGGVTLPPLPNSSAYYQAVTAAANANPGMSWGTFENTPSTGDFNDCTIAAAAHMTQLWTASVGPELKFSDGDVTAAYKYFVGEDTKKDLKYARRSRILAHCWHRESQDTSVRADPEPKR